ncbi:MAG: ABC transporter ATP-binding protein [Anaerolineaceae bacterium]
MIEVDHAVKSYGPVKALNDVSFTIADGEIVGLLGPNGAGKTTIIKILTGYLQPDSGRVSVAGLDVLTQTKAAQAHIGYLPETAPLYPELSVQQYLKMIADLRQIPEETQLERISEAVYAVDIEKYLTRPIAHLSKGYRQRVGIAQAMLNRPDLLILDEPTIGLDPTQIVEIRKLIKRLSAHSTVLFSTHILPEVEQLCDRVIILMNGQVKADSRLADLASTSNVILVLQNRTANVPQTLRTLGGVSRVDESTAAGGYPSFRIKADGKADLSTAVYQLAVQQNWPVRELRHDVRTLEMVFNELALAQ